MQNKKLDRRKALYLAFSILVASIIWVYADAVVGVNGKAVIKETEAHNIPIEYMFSNSSDNVEDRLAERGLMLLADGTDQTIDLTLSGPRVDIAKLDKSKIRVTVDLSNVTEAGSQRINYSVMYPDGTENITRKSASIKMATVNIAELYSRTVEVKCDLKGNVAEGFTAGQLQLSHTSIEIRGQQEDIDPVSYVKATLDLGKDAEATVSESLSYQFYDASGKVIDNSDGHIHTTVETIQATLPVSVTKELTLKMNFIESAGARKENIKAEIKPNTIQVSGEASVLKNIDSIVLDDFDLLSLEKQGSGVYGYPITVPEGCQNLSGVTRATLTISFVDMTSAELEADHFQCENVPEGKTAQVVTNQMTVKIFGTEADVAAVTAEDITLVADLSDFSAASGSYTVPVTVKINTSGDVGVSGSYQAQVNIQEMAAEPDTEEPSEEQE